MNNLFTYRPMTYIVRFGAFLITGAMRVWDESLKPKKQAILQILKSKSHFIILLMNCWDSPLLVNMIADRWEEIKSTGLWKANQKGRLKGFLELLRWVFKP